MIDLEKFTERARRALTLANLEARYLVTGQVEAAHLLFGVVQEASELLEELGADSLTPQRLRQRLKQELGPRLQASPWEPAEIQLAEDALRVLARAEQEARRAGTGGVDLMHLLAALAGEPDSLAARLLAEAGLTQERLRGLMGKQGGASPAVLER